MKQKPITALLHKKWVAVLLAVVLSGPWLLSVSAAQTQPDGVYLLVGYDQDASSGTARSDTMMLCRFDKSSGQLILVSLLRDLYVSIPGHGSNRLNAAYALGGIPLLKDTIRKNFQIDIDGCIEVDFSRFSQIIDILGGVELELRPDEAKLISQETGTNVLSGEQTLTGAQALSYARIRSLDSDGDFSRTKRQRKLLEALWEEYRDCSFPSLVRVMGSLVPMLRTDLEAGSLLRTAMDLSPHLSDMELHGYSIPLKQHCTDQIIDGMAVLVADPEQTSTYLRQYLFAESFSK